MRGEHDYTAAIRLAGEGSSPHARGTPTCTAIASACHGIIPACAGNTPVMLLAMLEHGDHPRMRGEHLTECGKSCPESGSSPHARGTPCRVEHVAELTGIIPACAGNTWWSAYPLPSPGDHPRMRGEHSAAARGIPVPTGSSPHARGTHRPQLASRVQPGIIPACAGNTP